MPDRLPPRSPHAVRLARAASCPTPADPAAADHLGRAALPVPAAAPARVPERLAALTVAGARDGTAPSLDWLTRLVTRLLRVPVALVTLVDADRVVFAGCTGLEGATAESREAPTRHAVCERVVAAGAPLVVDDLRTHPEFRAHPAATELGFAAYAGAPVVTAAGDVLGTVCAFDVAPRAWSAEDVATLEHLAQGAAAAFEVRLGADRERRLAAALEAQGVELAALLDATGEMVCATDADGRITFVNRAWRDALGYTAAEARRLRPVDLVAPEHRLRYLEAARALHAGEAADDFGAVLLARDGRRVACRGRAVPILEDAPDGAPGNRTRCVGARAFYRDVTAEHEAAAQRARLVATLEASPDLVGTVAPDGSVEYLNAAGRRLLGLRQDADLATLRAEDFHPPATRARLNAEGIPAAAREGRWAGEGHLRATDGREVPVSMVVVAHPATEPGAAPYFSAVMRDLSAQAAAAAERARERAFLEATLESLSDGLVACDAEGRLALFNRAAREFHGVGADASLAPDEWADRYALYEPDGVTPLAAEAIPLRRAYRGEVVRDVELVIAPSGGAPRTVRASGQPIRNAAGRTLGAVVAMRDVTDWVRATAALAAERTFLTTVLDALEEHVGVAAADGTSALLNRAAREALAAPPDLAVPAGGWGARFGVFQADGATPFPEGALAHQRVLATGAPALGVEYVLRTPGRAPRTMRGNAYPLRGAGGALTGAVLAARDVTAERAAERALAEREARLALIYDGARDLMFLMAVERGADGGATEYRCESVNAAYRAATGLADADLLGRTPEEILPREAAAFARARYDAALAAGAAQRYDETVDLPGGRLTVETTLTPVLDAGGTCTHLLGVARDVSAVRRAEAAVRESEALFRGILENVSALALCLDADGRVTFANDAFLAATGWPREAVLGADYFGRFVPAVPQAAAHYRRAMAAGTGEGIPAHYAVDVERRGGGARHVQWDTTVLRDADGRAVGVASVGQDVTEQRALQARLAALSEHDELTGLYNRRGFRRMAEHALKTAGRARRHDAVLYVDLDRFKPINDTHGHAAGDAALRAVAQVARATLRDADFAARLGGDEFAIYAVGMRPGDGQVVAARLRANLEAHNAAAAADGRPFRIGFSVGVAELEPGDDLDALLARADAGLYAQKLARSERGG